MGPMVDYHRAWREEQQTTVQWAKSRVGGGKITKETDKMEKEAQIHDSMTTVNIKPEYPPSEYSSEPPPAYPRTQSSSVQVAKIIAVTVVLVSVVLGSFILASAYVTANASCRQLEQELELLSEAADRFQASGPNQPEALVQEPPQPSTTTSTTTTPDSTSSEYEDDSDSESDNTNEENSVHFKLPLQLDFDDLAGMLLEKNQRSKMNCVVEKKRAEEVVDHQPKTLQLPFGVNLTTDPRYEKVTGERMAIFCESGKMVEATKPRDSDKNDGNDSSDSDDDDTILIQPVMVPIPQARYPTHMAQQQQPMVPHYSTNQQQPSEVMRPPPQFFPLQQQQQQQQQQSQAPQNPFLPNPILHHIAQQIIAQKIMEAQRIRQQQMMQQPRPIPEEILRQLNRLPNRGGDDEGNVIVVRRDEDSDNNDNDDSEVRFLAPHLVNVAQQQAQAQPTMLRIVVPQSQPEARQEEQKQDDSNGDEDNVRTILRLVPQQVNMLEHAMAPGSEDKMAAGRQGFARELPVQIPVHMIQEEDKPQPEGQRPHYVQPRSVRSVDAVLGAQQKRVKRCSCDCAC